MSSVRPGRVKTRLEIQIDPIRCDGYGYCVELMPEYLAFDDWGFPMIKEKRIGSQVARDLALRVEHLCPKLAFRVVEVPS